MSRSAGNRWPPEQPEVLRLAYLRGGMRGAREAFPGIGHWALRKQILKHRFPVGNISQLLAAGHAARKATMPVRSSAPTPLARRDPEIARRFAALDFGGFAGDFGRKRARRDGAVFV